jgi:hypothetical protein
MTASITGPKKIFQPEHIVWSKKCGMEVKIKKENTRKQMK